MKKHFIVGFSFFAVIAATLIYDGFLTAKSKDETPIVAIFDGKIRSVNITETCTIHEWASKLGNRCKCNLIRHAWGIIQNKETATELLEKLTNRGDCDSKSIHELLKVSEDELKQPHHEERLKKAIINLYQHSLLIDPTDVVGITFDANGHMNENGLKELIKRAYAEGFLKDPAFADMSCLSAKNIIGEKGLTTEQLFLVQSKCAGGADFIVKDMRVGEDEAIRLTTYSQNPALEKIKGKPGFPEFIFPFAYLQYDYNDDIHVLSFMKRAQGEALVKFMEDYSKNPSKENEARVKQAYYQIGKTMGMFYREFMEKSSPQEGLGRTILHGDLHQKNIFFNPANNKVTLIDNERIEFNKERPQDWEIPYMFYISFGDKVVPETIYNTMDKQHWAYITLSSFLDGFIPPFPMNRQKFILEDLQNKFKEYYQFKEHPYERYKDGFDKAFREAIDKLTPQKQ